MVKQPMAKKAKERDIRQMDPRLKYVDLHHKNQHSHVAT